MLVYGRNVAKEILSGNKKINKITTKKYTDKKKTIIKYNNNLNHFINIK